MEKEKLEKTLKQGQEVPPLLNCIEYLVIVILTTIFLFYISEYFWLRLYTTQGASGLLNLFGINSYVYPDELTNSVDITAIVGKEYTFSVIKICSGIEAIAFISGLVLATPTSWKRKLAGSLFITFGIFGANILRIVTTVVLATQGYESYIYHEVVSAIFTVIFIIVFILMIQAWIIPNFIDSLINTLIGLVRAVKGH